VLCSWRRERCIWRMRWEWAEAVEAAARMAREQAARAARGLEMMDRVEAMARKEAAAARAEQGLATGMVESEVEAETRVARETVPVARAMGPEPETGLEQEDRAKAGPVTELAVKLAAKVEPAARMKPAREAAVTVREVLQTVAVVQTATAVPIPAILALAMAH